MYLQSQLDGFAMRCFASSSRNWTLALHLAMSAAGLGNSEPRVDDERCACIAITSQ